VEQEGHEGHEDTVGINIKWLAVLHAGGKCLLGGKECRSRKGLKGREKTEGTGSADVVKEVLRKYQTVDVEG
jgi:hypothetical protein